MGAPSLTREVYLPGGIDLVADDQWAFGTSTSNLGHRHLIWDIDISFGTSHLGHGYITSSLSARLRHRSAAARLHDLTGGHAPPIDPSHDAWCIIQHMMHGVSYST
eukprot:GHVO01050062.1.p1 GENE.GHVO01050062.1~~GHVO01050062.1.p1  ORF type:complete len:106 (-),score=28.51 GHVO01050062.1:331-648(-)